ncbi:MAG: ExbD/TolR family protein [Kofleriaceae bacterium]
MVFKSLSVVAVLAVASAGCGQEEIRVHREVTNDYNRRALAAAVDKFVAEHRTPDAYAELSRTVLALRSGMDRTVAEEAELKLIVLALAPVQSVQAKPFADQVDVLALTVWPTLLAPAVEADEVLDKRDPRSAQLMPVPNETTGAYLERLCGGPLASECKQVVPEQQGAVISALATRRAMERARNAIADCTTCASESGWKEAVRSWEQLDRTAHSWISDVERRGDPDNWPVAGNAAEGFDPNLPLAELNRDGEIVIAGQRYGGGQRIDALRDLRGRHTEIALHLRPELSLAQVRGVIVDAAKAGARKVAIIAREPQYPWERKIYWVANNGTTRADLRPTDSLQSLLHAVDYLGGPGVVARVD